MSDESGFTMVETVVGLSLLLVVLGIFALYLLPLLVRAPALSADLRQTLEIAQAQALALRVSRELSIPPWWPPSFLEQAEGSLVVHDLGSRHTTRQEARPDLLSLRQGAAGLEMQWGQTRFVYPRLGQAKLSLALAEDKRPLAIIVTVPAAATPFILTIPLSNAVELNAKQ